ncbi:hypothetical protein HY768_00740 [candidate division TA06 bacterium]|uniref:Uncharacterized protein n=1 Tax=candidate division TA06 bacterium TaxID=2250710 RepID=A0A933MIL4_UNCT6|nr:hypothetical protein [candidate division TA06 bacterium]
MKTRSGIFILALILAISGCSKDEPTATGGSVLPSSYLMPDSVGQSWHYNGYETILGYDTLGNKTDSSTYIFSLDINIISRDTINGYQTFTTELACHGDTSFWGSEKDTGRVRYAQNDTLLAEVAYVPGTPGGPKQKGLRLIRFGGKIYNDIGELRNAVLFGSGSGGKYDTTLIPYDPPRILLDYPLSRGKEWVHYNTAWLSHRKVEKTERTIVNGHYYYCWKIKSLLDVDGDSNWDTDIIWYDWYNNSGMVKRHLEMQGVWIGPAGELLGTFVYVEHYELANP